MPQNRATNRAFDFKATQRKRLLTNMLAAINANGYIDATIADVIALASVSRPTFYEYFTDKDDCFLALYRDISKHLLDQVAHAVDDSPPEKALEAVVRQLTQHAETEPVQAQFLASAALAGGPRALDERERTISQINNAVETAHGTASPQTPSPDMPTLAVVGATQWLIAQRVRRGEQNLAQLTQELTDWLRHYEHPTRDHLWCTPNPGPRSELSPRLSELADGPPPPVLSQRSHRLPSKLAEGHRWRILLATAQSAVQAGYAATTVTAITARARLNRHVFYEHFRDKRHAFLTLHELAFQQSVTVGGTAYFNEKEWPERVWRCLLATSQLHAANPAIAHVGFVETHTLGLPAIQRVEDSRHAFATLLRADNQNTSPLPSVTAAEAIGAAIFEIAHDRVRQQRAKDLPRYAYHATYLALAPFLGVQTANHFVQRKLEDAQRRPARAKRHKRS